jgi:hypothetical protein
METRSAVIVNISLQPKDVYHHLLLSWRNVSRWVLALFGIIFLGWLFFPYFRVWSMFRSSPLLRTPRRVSFGAEGIHVESEHGRGDYKWSVFQKIVESRKMFFFMQTTYTGALCVPKRCLSDRDDLLKLRQVIRDNFHGEPRLRID